MIKRNTLFVVLAATFLLAPAALNTALAVERISITQADSPDPVASGAELTYTITVTNVGGAKLDDVIMTNQVHHLAGIGVPPQLVLTSTKGSCTQSAFDGFYLVTCSAGSLAGRESFTVTIRGVVTAPDGATINNTASVTATKSAHNFTATTTTTTFVSNTPMPNLPDLTITKAGPSSTVISTPLLYTLTVNNIGDVNATDIMVVDTLPADVDLVSVSANSLFECTPAGPMAAPVTVTCTGGRINAGSNATITIQATSPAATGTITNTAVVDPNDTIVESDELNNTSAAVGTTVTSGPTSPGLVITKDDNPDPVRPGEMLTYTIVVTNTGSGPHGRADNVMVVDGTQGLEASTIVASADVNGEPGTCTVNAPQVTCQPPGPQQRLDGGESMDITITGQVVGSAGTTLINTATVTGNIKNKGVSSTATTITTVMPSVDLTITKADEPDPVCARSWPDTGGLSDLEVCEGGLTYTLVVGNSGIDTATGVLVRDPLPEGLVLDSFVAPDFAGGCAVDPENVLTCTDGTIGPQATTTITFVLVAPPNTGPITNTVTVDPNNAIYEADETNNTFAIDTQVDTGIDLAIFKYDEPTNPVNPDPEGPYDPVTEGFDPIATSGTQVYTIVVDNIGTQDAIDIRVRDFLPADTTFLTAEGDNDFQCSYVETDHYVECVQGRIRGTASEVYFGDGADDARITIKLFAQPVVGAMHNEVKVDPLHEIDEVNEENNVITEDTVVTNGGAILGAFNELTISKVQTSPANPVARNGNLVYTITIGNDATDPAVNITVEDTLPTGSVFREAKDSEPGPDAFFCSESGGVVTCTGGTLSGTVNAIAGVPTSRTIVVKLFAPDTPGTYNNVAIVDPANAIPEGDEFNNVSTVETIVVNGGNDPFNELTIDKTDDPDPVATSSILTYTITVGNTGSDPAFEVVVRDTLPTGSTFIDAISTGGFLCNEAGGVVECVGGDIAPAGSETITIRVFSPAVPGDYQNIVRVDPDNQIPEGNETNNEKTIVTTVNVGSGYIDLTASKTDAVDPVIPGGMITYELIVNNNGTNPAFNVKVRDVLPAGTTFVSAADTAPGAAAFICGEAGGVVDCIGGTIDGSLNLIGLPTSRTIAVKVLAPTDIKSIIVPPANLDDIYVDIINQALIDPDNTIPEANEINNSASETTKIQSDINLTIEKTGPSTTQQGEQEEYVLKVKNTGTATALGVEVHDALPVGLIPLNITTGDGNNFICQMLENPVNVLDCVGDLNSDQEVTITVRVFMTLESGSFDNEACVDPADKIEETNEIDNCSTKTTVVVPGGTPENEALNPGSCTDTIDNDGDGLTDADDPGCAPPEPDLSVHKFADSGLVTLGQTLTYTINVSNVGGADAPSPITVTDTLPEEVDFVNASATNGFTCGEAAGTVTCTDPGSGLAVGGNTQITIQVTVDGDRVEQGAGPGSCTDTIDNDGDGLTDAADPDCTGPFTNTAAADTGPGEDGAGTGSCIDGIDNGPDGMTDGADPDCPDTNTGNNSDSVDVSIGAANVELVLVSFTDSPDPVTAGQTLEYTVVAANAGTSTAIGVEVLIEDVEPAGVDFVGAAGSNGFLCSFSDPDVSCTGNLDPAGSTIITIQVMPNAAAPITLASTATVDPTDTFTEVDETNNSLIADTTVTGSICSSCIDLVMGSTLDTEDPVAPGDTVTLIFTAGNTGDLGTTGVCPIAPDPCVRIRITLPTPDLDLVPASLSATGGFTCADTDPDPNVDVVECEGDLNPAQGVIITMDVDVDPGIGVDKTVVTTAEIDPTTDNPATIPIEFELFPVGAGPTDEFTNANNTTTEDTFIDVP
jgi:uncharacterized repeat protein (TIGR01451 family)